MTEQELYNEYRESGCKSFTDFLINRISELKEELKKREDEWQEQVQKANDEGYARTLRTIQLTKAKEIIKKFSEFVNNDVEYDPEHPQEHTDLWNELCEEAEQFLKG